MAIKKQQWLPSHKSATEYVISRGCPGGWCNDEVSCCNPRCRSTQGTVPARTSCAPTPPSHLTRTWATWTSSLRYRVGLCKPSLFACAYHGMKKKTCTKCKLAHRIALFISSYSGSYACAGLTSLHYGPNLWVACFIPFIVSTRHPSSHQCVADAAFRIPACITRCDMLLTCIAFQCRWCGCWCDW